MNTPTEPLPGIVAPEIRTISRYRAVLFPSNFPSPAAPVVLQLMNSKPNTAAKVMLIAHKRIFEFITFLPIFNFSLHRNHITEAPKSQNPEGKFWGYFCL
jgi:hypothetical protein